MVGLILLELLLVIRPTNNQQPTNDDDDDFFKGKFTKIIYARNKNLKLKS